MSEDTVGHDPVLLAETLDALDLRPGATVVDCTLGRGGHALATAERIGPTGLLIGLDADPRNLQFAQKRLDGVACKVRLFHANFAELSEVLRQAQVPAVDAILADLGLSTNQFLDPSYGLSFSNPGELDMRIDPRTRRSAADWVNHTPEGELADVLYKLADERYSRRIARKIGDGRRVAPITTTDRLAELVRSAYPPRHGPPDRIDPATRTFMALRMAVNDEVGNLASLLETGPKLLKKPGRMAVISFHSVEDRMVKQAFRSAEQTGQVRLVLKRPVTPSGEEIARNVRSRSAKLRAAERI